jgi:hypothetical protein
VLRFGRLAGGEETKSEKKPDEKEKSSPALNRYLLVMAQFDESQIAKPELETVPGEDQPADGTKPTEDKPAEDKPADAKGDDEKVPETKTADDETKAETPAAKDKAAAEEKPEAKQEAKPATPDEEKRIAIQKENKRKQDSYDSAIKKGQDRVQELNERFADWYYVISDDVYKKIHLGRSEIVKKKETKEVAEPTPA